MDRFILLVLGKAMRSIIKSVEYLAGWAHVGKLVELRCFGVIWYTFYFSGPCLSNGTDSTERTSRTSTE